MPELHSNQIAWQAPELPKANFDSVNYQPLADAANYLSNVGKDISSKLDAMQDDQLKADLKLAEDRANAIIDEAASADADYEKLSEMMLSEVQGAFYKYDEATRIRFNRENKTYFDELQLAVTEKILKKKGQELETRVDINIPLWASEVFSAPEGQREAARKAGIKKIQETLKGYSSPDVIDRKVFTFNNMIDKANLNNLITAGTDESLARAKTYINNPKMRASLDPYEISVFNARILASEKENAVAKGKAGDPRAKKLIEKYGTWASSGATPMTEEMFYAVQNGDTIPVILQDEAGNPYVENIDTKELTSEQRLAIITEFKKLDVLNPNFEKDKNSFNAEVNQALTLYKASVDNADSNQGEALQRLIDLSNSRMFRHIENGTQTNIIGLINAQMAARVEASLGEEQQFTVNKYGALTSPGLGVLAVPYDKKVGNPVELLTSAVRSKKYYTPTGNDARGAMMTKLLRDQGAQQNTSPYFVQPIKDAGVLTRASALGAVNTDPYNKNITAMMMGAAKIWRDRFAKDMESNSIAELGLYNKILLPAYRDNQLLEGTRFNKTNRTYEKAFNQWCYELKRNGLYNQRVNNDNASNVERFYEIVVGDKLTPLEKDYVKQFENITKSGQANRDFSDFEAKVFGPKAPDTVAVSGSKPKPNYDYLGLANKLSVSSREEKAIEKSGF